MRAESANVTRYQIFQTAISTALRVGKFGLRIIFKDCTSDGQRKTAKAVGQYSNAKGKIQTQP